MTGVEILIISSERDFSTDYVCATLSDRGASFLRINREQFPTSKTLLDPISGDLCFEFDGRKVQLSRASLKSVYFRAPVYLRETVQADANEEEQLTRSQWAAFLRALVIFDQTRWVNHPQATYLAEIKAYQLHVASKVGLTVPRTSIGNASPDWVLWDSSLAVKSLDSAVVQRAEETGFTFTQFLNGADAEKEDFSTIPVIIQESIEPKLDIRVFVVGNRTTCISITDIHRSLITGDWRACKAPVVCALYDAPREVLDQCRLLVQKLKLSFAAIDLVARDGKHLFLEVNPTGEWGWVMDVPGISLDREIADLLIEYEPVCV